MPEPLLLELSIESSAITSRRTPPDLPIGALTASIVIPTLNESKIIGPFLQQFTPDLRRRLGLELIVSDGGSTDGTIEIAEQFADRVVVYSDPHIQTISAGRNAGGMEARGEVLLFFNADVKLPAPLDHFLLDLIGSTLKCGAATCRVSVDPKQARLSDQLVLGFCNILFNLMNRIGVGAGRGECHAITRSMFEMLGGYNEALVAGEDFELFGRVAAELRRGQRRISFLGAWVVYENPRRYRHLGYPKTMCRWFLNFFCVTFLKKSHSKSWEPVR